jgi:hypothetical protein
MGLALSRASEPARAAAWVEGFLGGSGALLLHDDALWALLDAWLVQLPEESFTAMLPLLRRTFATFPAPERRQMGERVKRGPSRAATSAGVGGAERFNRVRAEEALATVARLLGVDGG